MERIYQMNVVPDILPAFHPSVDLRIVFPVQRRKTAFRRPDEKQRQSAVEPGVFLVPEQVRKTFYWWNCWMNFYTFVRSDRLLNLRGFSLQFSIRTNDIILFWWSTQVSIRSIYNNQSTIIANINQSPDVPNQREKSFTTYLHWMMCVDNFSQFAHTYKTQITSIFSDNWWLFFSF